jgi:rRNA methylases
MTIVAVTSSHNERLKLAARLLRSAHERRKSALCVLEGEHLIEMYVAQHGAPTALIITEAFQQHPLVSRCQQTADVCVVSDALFSATATLPSEVGMLAMVSIPSPRTTFGTFHLLLEDVQDPGNVGTMLRSAAAAGVTHAIFSKNNAAAWSPKVLRAAQGAHFLLDIVEDVDVVGWARQFRCQGGKIAAMVAHGGSDLFQCDLSCLLLAVAVGNEGSGLSTALLEQTDWQLTIPMPGAMESLNVASAAAIVLFECVRQRRAC